MQSDGSKHEQKRLKYKRDSIVCPPQSYPFSDMFIISSRNIKYTTSIEFTLLFRNITNPNKSKQNAHVYL
jgi:hypothetical protein